MERKKKRRGCPRLCNAISDCDLAYGIVIAAPVESYQ